MAFSIPKTSYKSMMKDGTRHYQGLEEAVFQVIHACKQLALLTRSSYGPNGMKKIVINHIDKLFVTKDAATILKELEVENPAGKVMVMASRMAEQEVGDGTNFVIQFAAALLGCAGELLNYGIAPCDIIDGYKFALKKSLEILPNIVCSEITDLRDISKVSQPIKSAISTKQMIHSDHISKIVANACVSAKSVYSKIFDVDNVRSVKILGGGCLNSNVQRGLVVKSNVEGFVREVKNAKLAIFNTDYDLMNTETKGTVLLNTANELLSFSKEEEGLMKQFVASLKKLGCNVVVTSGKVSDQALDFSNRENIMVLRVTSKFELQRLARATQSYPLSTLSLPTLEQLGHCDSVSVEEIGDTKVVVFSQEVEESAVSTVILRGSSESVLDDLERSVDDGVNCYKSLSHDPRLLPGAGAVEMELVAQLDRIQSTLVGLEQHAVSKFSDSLRSIVRCIAENNGLNANEALSKLYGQHSSGQKNQGLDITDPVALTCDASASGIFDLLYVKKRCMELAVDVASTLLSISLIVIARPAGGPVPKQNTNWDAD